jgi:UDP-N-acetylmuramoylalanine--D-glutamate ligase
MTTIEFLTQQGSTNKYSDLAGRKYNNILTARNKVMLANFAQQDIITARVKEVATIRGIKFIDDSLSIKPNSTWFMLATMTQSLIWIMGNGDCHCDMTSLIPIAREKVRIIINCGKREIAKPFMGLIPTIINTNNISEAVKAAYLYAAIGETVVYSPSCGEKTSIAENSKEFSMAINEL